MVRKLALLVSLGFLCLVAGIFSSRSAASDCDDVAVDTGIYCPVQIGDDPNHACNDPVHNGDPNGGACTGAKAVKDINPNTSVTKGSTGSYVKLQYIDFFTPQTVACYIRINCKWNGTTCVDDTLENVYQLVYKTEHCPIDPPPPGGD